MEYSVKYTIFITKKKKENNTRKKKERKKKQENPFSLCYLLEQFLLE